GGAGRRRRSRSSNRRNASPSVAPFPQIPRGKPIARVKGSNVSGSFWGAIDKRSAPRRSETMIDGITWFKQSAFLFQREHNLYIDPLGITDGSPMADAILLTHAHADHFSPDDLAKIRQDSTVIYATADVAAQ